MLFILGATCAILAIIIAREDDKYHKTSVEKGMLEGQVAEMQKELSDYRASFLPGPTLSVDDISRAISLTGYVPEPLEGWIRFRVQQNSFFVDTQRLPLVMITHTFSFKTSDWDPERLRDAGRKVTEEMIMLKVDIEEKEDENHLFRGQIFIAAMDRNFSSFHDNLKVYINLLDDGMHRMAELYEKQEQKDESTVAMESFLVQKAKDNQAIS